MGQKKKRTKKKIDTQEDLMDVGTESIKELEDAALNLKEVRMERMQMTKEEVEASQLVIELLRKHELDVYKCRTFDATVTLKHGKDRVSVRMEQVVLEEAAAEE